MENNTANPSHLHVTQGSEGSTSQGHWPEVLAALNTNNYERVSDLLRVIGTSAPIAIQSELIQIALQICLACINCRSEVEWHLRASQEADARERELRQRLETMLIAIMNAKGEQEPSVKQELPRNLMSHPSRNQFISGLTKSPDIWKRLRAFLRFQPEQVSNPDKENILAPKNEPDELIAPSTKEEKPDHIMAKTRRESDDELRRIQEETPLLVIYCLGTFRVYQDEQPIEEWPSSKGKSIFKYLLAHRERPVAKEVLMDVFWPDADVDSARNNLNVAIYGLRQALKNGRSRFSHVLFQNDSYQLNPETRFWTDYEAFMKGRLIAQTLERNGELEEAIREYASTETLYQGEFLEEDRYEDWLLPIRQRLQDDYIGLVDQLIRLYYQQHDLLNCAHFCLKMLAIDTCREDAHRHLMRCYHDQGQSYLALRQYHICCEALKKELDIAPSKATRELYELIRRQNGG